MSTADGDNYTVSIEKYAERHFIKSFSKKYKGAWNITQIAIVEQFRRFVVLVGATNNTEKILIKDSQYIVKHDFKIAGTKESTKTSGDRAIVYVDVSLRECRVLLVYSKNDISPPNETQKWQALIRENYSDIWSKFS